MIVMRSETTKEELKKRLGDAVTKAMDLEDELNALADAVVQQTAERVALDRAVNLLDVAITLLLGIEDGKPLQPKVVPVFTSRRKRPAALPE